MERNVFGVLCMGDALLERIPALALQLPGEPSQQAEESDQDHARDAGTREVGAAQLLGRGQLFGA